jgi:hypothetical protein
MWELRDKEANRARRQEQREVMDRLAQKIVERRLAAPAILFIESIKPVSFLGNQALIFFQPIVQSIVNFKSYDEIAGILEDRENLEYLLTKIEALEGEQSALAREDRRRRRDEKRSRKTPKDGADE